MTSLKTTEVNIESQTLSLALSMLSYKQAHAVNYYAFSPKFNHNVLSISKFIPYFYFNYGEYKIDENSLERCIYFLELEDD